MSTEFEFNDKLITFIADELHNCKYGDFFFDCEAERVRNEVRDKTFTLWFTVDMNKDFFRNQTFVGLEKCSRVTRLPLVEYERLRYWREYYGRYSED